MQIQHTGSISTHFSERFEYCMSSFFTLFDILAIIYIFRSVQLGLKIWREWPQLRIEPFTPHKKHLAEQASYFIAVPLGVLAHELGHVLAVWAAGGQVAEFHYRAFWGYVVPIGNFSPAQNWFIAIAGTLASLAFGLLIWLLFRRMDSSTLRYFGVRAFRFQVYFSLVYYPLFTLFGFDGDWKTIYDFSATPWLSTVTAVLHAGTLLLFWRGDRTGWFEAPSHESVEAQERFEQLALAAAASPQDAQLQIQYIDALRRGGAKHKAKHHLENFMVDNPNSAVGHLELAALYAAGRGQIPKKASASAEEALNLGLSDPRQAAFAHEFVGRYQLDTGQVETAITHFTQAITALADMNPGNAERSQMQLHILRSQAYRRQQQHEQAYQDLLLATTLAQRNGDEAGVAQVQQELETLENHAGHTFGATSMKIP
jgi:tetratricopeptide (TPR) repeat protein